jgi:hypothetical protein
MDSIMQWTFRGAGAFAMIAMIAIFIAQGVVPSSLRTFRFQELPPVPETWSNVPAFETDDPVCSTRYQGLSIIDALGLALGGYDVKRNLEVFTRQMEYFLGPGATERISYSVEELAPDIPVVIYNVSGTTVFGFRGFATGAELAIQADRLAQYYGAPLLTDITPWYEQVTNMFLSRFTAAARLFGRHWFTGRSAFDDLLQKALTIYNDEGLTPGSSVVFVGINTGGLLAKVLGMLTEHRGIGFISMPANCDEFQFQYEFDERHLKWGTNIFNLDGLFGVTDEGIGANFVLTGSPGVIGMDAVYPSFCNLAEICGLGEQFRTYCETAIGSESVAEIRSFFATS